MNEWELFKTTTGAEPGDTLTVEYLKGGRQEPAIFLSENLKEVILMSKDGNNIIVEKSSLKTNTKPFIAIVSVSKKQYSLKDFLSQRK
jgi:hypothetical protein